MFRTIFILVFAVALMMACGEQSGSEDTKKQMVLDKKKAAPVQVDGSQFVIKKLPPNIQRVDANLEKKAILLGYSINTDTAMPGQVLNVTWYWRSLSTITGTWEYFTHLVNEEGELVQSVNSQGPMRSAYKPQMWKPGEIIKDMERIVIPQNWTSSVLELRTGLWFGPNRLNVVSGPADAENRIKGPIVSIVTDAPKPTVGTTTATEIPFAKTAPRIDGKLDDAAWESANRLERFKNSLNGGMVKAPTDMRLMWDDRYLYVGMIATDTELDSPFTERDQELWRADAVDLFIQPLESGSYYEIQVSPNGIIFDASYASYRQANIEWNSGADVAVSVNGEVNGGDGSDTDWTVEMAIPFASIVKADGSTLAADESFSANFFRIDKTSSSIEYSAWSPPMRGDFHALDRMGKIHLKK